MRENLFRTLNLGDFYLVTKTKLLRQNGQYHEGKTERIQTGLELGNTGSQFYVLLIFILHHWSVPLKAAFESLVKKGLRR